MARNHYSKSLKARVALEAIKGQKTMVEIISEYGVHAMRIGVWKKQLMDRWTVPQEIFSRSKGSQERKQVLRLPPVQGSMFQISYVP